MTTSISMPGWAETATKAVQEVPREYIHSTVPIWDPPAHRYLMGERPFVENTQRATQWVFICMAILARQCAAQGLGLYRRARSNKRVGRNFHRVDAKQLAYMRRGTSKAIVHANAQDDVERVTDHRILDVLRRPNARESGYTFMLSRWMDLEISGNFMQWVVDDSDGVPAQLYRLAPHKTAILPSRDRFIEGYRYGWTIQDKVTFDATEVDHFWFMPSLWSPYFGMSWVQAVLLDADRYSASTQHDLTTLRSSGRPDWMLKLPANAGKAQMETAREEINRRLRGPENQRGVLITTGEELMAMQWSPRDLEFIASRSDARQLILGAAGVPEPIFSMNDSNRASALTALVQFARLSIEPRLVNDANELNAKFLPRFGLTPGDYWLQYDDPVPDDTQMETDRKVKLTSAGIMLPDECRAEENLEPLPGGAGAVPRFNGVPLDALGAMRVDSMGAEGAVLKPGEEAKQEPVAGAGADVQATALNGAQVTSLQEMLQSGADGKLPLDTIRAAIESAFPVLTDEQIEGMVSPLEDFEPKVEEPTDVNGNGTAGPTGQGGSAARGDGGGQSRNPAGGGKTGDAVRAIRAAAGGPGSEAGGGGEGDRADTGAGGQAGRGAGGNHEGADDARVATRRRLSLHPAYTEDTHVHKDDDWAKPSPAQRKAEAELERVMRGWYEQVEVALKAGKTPAEAMEGMGGELEDALKPVLESLLREGALAELASRGSDADTFRLTPAPALHYLENYTPRLALEVARNTLEAIRVAEARAVDEGLSVADTQEAVARALGTETNYRAERIARTETANVLGRGQLEAWKKIGVPSKRFLPSPTACEMCLTLGARGAIPIEEPFARVGEMVGGTQVGWQDVQTSPAHPNCFCDCLPVEGDEK